MGGVVVTTPELSDALEIDVVAHQVQSNGVRWFIERSEGNV
jgi:hypothetical protein